MARSGFSGFVQEEAISFPWWTDAALSVSLWCFIFSRFLVIFNYLAFRQWRRRQFVLFSRRARPSGIGTRGHGLSQNGSPQMSSLLTSGVWLSSGEWCPSKLWADAMRAPRNTWLIWRKLGTPPRLKQKGRDRTCVDWKPGRMGDHLGDMMISKCFPCLWPLWHLGRLAFDV